MPLSIYNILECEKSFLESNYAQFNYFNFYTPQSVSPIAGFLASFILIYTRCTCVSPPLRLRGLKMTSYKKYTCWKHKYEHSTYKETEKRLSCLRFDVPWREIASQTLNYSLSVVDFKFPSFCHSQEPSGAIDNSRLINVRINRPVNVPVGFYFLIYILPYIIILNRGMKEI